MSPPDPSPPPLPKHAPAGLEDFAACRTERLELVEGKADWLPSPPGVGSLFSPKVRILPTTTPAEAEIAVGWAIAKLRLRAAVVHGELVVEPKGARLPLLGDVYDNVDQWVSQLNRWMAANGWRLGPPVITNGRLTLVKERLSAEADADPGAD